MKVGNHGFIQGNCLYHMENSPGNLFDVVVTSPQYNIGVKYRSSKDNLKPEDYFQFLNQAAHQIKRLLKDDGSLFLNIGSKPTDPLTPFKVVMIFAKIFQLQNTFHWIKSISIGDNSSGHYKPIQSERFVNDCHEYIFHFTKNGKVQLNRKSIGVQYKDPSNAKRFNNENGLRCRGNNWFIPYKTIQSRDKERPHPATFPVQLVENCLKIHGVDKIEWVLDPFAGIGTTAVACEKLKLKSVNIDLDEFYLNQAVERVNKEYGRK